MAKRKQTPLHGIDEDLALRSILEGTATETGERFFAALVENVARALKTQGCWVTEYLEGSRRLRALTVIATFCLIPYFYFLPESLMIPIYWNLFFIMLNIYWIIRLGLSGEHTPKLSREPRHTGAKRP